MKHDIVADCMSSLKNAESVGKSTCFVPMSKLVKNILEVMKKNGYIEDFEESGNKFLVKLNKKINDCNVIRPRFSVNVKEFDKWKKRYLPARDFGILILTTNQGVMDHNEAEKRRIGGKLLCYVY
ncbi:MAG: 30S ribosomal protein S8 [Candidatus Aenigmarchaeota archaeon]|nr:30S ribosomal protein S8 [Candidatus Aenigmarchaeota archaeon]